jgi:hypothetical protein
LSGDLEPLRGCTHGRLRMLNPVARRRQNRLTCRLEPLKRAARH